MAKLHYLNDPKLLRGLPEMPGGGEPPMDARLDRLEQNLTDVRVAVGKIETRLEHIERGMQGMVTKGNLATYAVIGLLGVLGGGWWIVQQYLAPILAALP